MDTDYEDNAMISLNPADYQTMASKPDTDPLAKPNNPVLAPRKKAYTRSKWAEEYDLSRKQERFVQEYLTDFNGTQAAIRAGYSKRSAGELACGLLAKHKMKCAVDMAMATDAAGLRARIAEELAAIALADPTNIASWDKDGVVLKSSADLTSIEKAAISEISQTRDGVKVKLSDKQGALEKLAKVTGMYRDDGGTKVGVQIVLSPEDQALF